MVLIYLSIAVVELLLTYLVSRSVVSEIYMLFMEILRDKKKSIYSLAVFFLLGTFIHEMAHFITALFLLVPVWEINLLPEIDDNDQNVKLGSVPIGQTDLIRRMLIGVAPVLMGIGIILTIVHYGIYLSLYKTPLFFTLGVLLIFQLANTMFSSKKDLEGTIEFFAVSLFIGLVVWIIKLKIPHIEDIFIESSVLYKVIQATAVSMSIPFVVNFVLFLLIKFINSRFRRRRYI